MRTTAAEFVFAFKVRVSTPTCPRHITWRQVKNAGFARPGRTVREDRWFFYTYLTERSVRNQLWGTHGRETVEAMASQPGWLERAQECAQLPELGTVRFNHGNRMA